MNHCALASVIRDKVVHQNSPDLSFSEIPHGILKYFAFCVVVHL